MLTISITSVNDNCHDRISFRHADSPKLGELLNGIQYGHDQIVLTKAGKPVAAMVDAKLFEKILLLKHEFNRLIDQLAVAYAGVESDAAGDIAEAVAAVSPSKVGAGGTAQR